MSKRSLVLIYFALAAAAQLAVPVRMIMERERTPDEGAVFRFKTQPVIRLMHSGGVITGCGRAEYGRFAGWGSRGTTGRKPLPCWGRGLTALPSSSGAFANPAGVRAQPAGPNPVDGYGRAESTY